MQNPDGSAGPYLSEKEAERYFKRHEMPIELSHLFDYGGASDRALPTGSKTRTRLEARRKTVYNQHMNWWQQPFVQVALPIIVTFAIATLYQGKRIDDLRDSMNKRFDAVDRRLERIESLLTDHDRRITVLEERTSPLHR